MKIAVVTPHYQPRAEWFETCLLSVMRQTLPCTHFLINDGGTALSAALYPGARLIDIPGPHRDSGNAARAVGSVLAACSGFDAVAYLDADNWYEPDHLEALATLYQRTGAAVCTSARRLHHLDGSILGVCPEVDGEQFVDTNCLFLTRAAFPLLSCWYLIPAAQALMGDRFLWAQAKKSKVSHAHSGKPTVAYRTSYKAHYTHFGITPPRGTKVLIHDAVQGRYVLREG